jgi:hypothetical protein
MYSILETALPSTLYSAISSEMRAHGNIATMAKTKKPIE